MSVGLGDFSFRWYGQYRYLEVFSFIFFVSFGIVIIQELIGTLSETAGQLSEACSGNRSAPVAPADGGGGSSSFEPGKKSPTRMKTQSLGVLSVRGSSKELKRGYVEKAAAKSGGLIALPESEEELMALADHLAAVKVQAMFRGREGRKAVSEQFSDSRGSTGGSTTWTRTKVGPPSDQAGS